MGSFGDCQVSLGVAEAKGRDALGALRAGDDVLASALEVVNYHIVSG